MLSLLIASHHRLVIVARRVGAGHNIAWQQPLSLKLVNVYLKDSLDDVVLLLFGEQALFGELELLMLG